MSLFYLGINPRYQSFPWLPDGVNLMYSAAGFWNGHQWRRKHRFLKAAGKRWLDFGGFTMLNLYGDYPFSIPEAMNLVAYLKPDFYGSLDYPCEPEISRKISLLDNLERIKATVRNARAMAEWESHVDGCSVPVIQGFTLEEYKTCIDLYQRVGMIRPYMAVGSMCRRISAEQLHQVIPGIYEHARRAGVERLHFFGLKLSPELIDLGEFIHSRDSAVALDSYSDGLREKRNGRRWPRGPQEKKESFACFFERLEMLNLSYRQ